MSAHITGVEVHVAAVRETTAFGAALMAGLGIGLWNDQAETATLWQEAAFYTPHSGSATEALYHQWLRAVE
jgi:glycerol kinase